MVAAASTALVVVATTASAVHTESFQLDGDISAAASGNFTTPSTTDPYDWTTFFQRNATTGDISKTATLPAGYVTSAYKVDYALPDQSTFATGSKDTLPIGTGWQCASSNNLSAKDDLLNVYQVAYRDPTSGHLIIDFGAEKSSNLGDNNIGLWLLKDSSVDCSSTKSATNFGGHHSDGDVLLTAAFTNGGGTANVNAYRWTATNTSIGGGDGGSLDTTPISSTNLTCVDPNSHVTPPNDNLCAITNRAAIAVTWNSPAKTSPGTGQLASEEFYEGALDLSGLGLSGCYNTAITDTRSSQSPTATIFDFARDQLSTCGTLHVHKYLDPALDGRSDGQDVTTGSGVSGWSFSVTNSSGTVVCSGTTDSTGTFNCPNLPGGTYTVTETQQSGYFNTDPGTVSGGTTTPFNTAGTVTKTITTVGGDANVYFGNECYVTKTFEVDNVPTGAAAPGSITVNYTVNSGYTGGTATTGSVSLSPDLAKNSNGSVWDGSVANYFTEADNISWSWYVGTDSAHAVTGQTNESLAGDGYPACSALNQVNFPFTTVTGFKYKDLNGTGTNTPLNGFSFQLINSAGTVVDTASSATTAAGSGIITFSNVAPGTYTVHELGQTGWVQTYPLTAGGAPTDYTVTVHLGDTSDSFGTFDNTPLSNLGLTFTPQANLPGTTTAATKASITCQNSGNTAVGSQTGNTYTADNLKIGTYSCSVVITDP